MKALFNEDALIEMGHPAVYNIQPNGMKTNFEWLSRIVVAKKGAGRTPDADIEQGIDQGFLVFEVDVQGAGGNTGFFGYLLHGDPRQSARLYQV